METKNIIIIAVAIIAVVAIVGVIFATGVFNQDKTTFVNRIIISFKFFFKLN